MRIIHVMTHLRLGAGRAIVDLCVEQRRRGHAVQVTLSTDAEGAWASDPALVGELEAGGIEVATIGDTFHRDAPALGAAAEALRSIAGTWRAPTVAHAHTAMAGAVAQWAGAPVVVVTCHGWNLQRPPEYDLQDALALTMPAAVISPSIEWARRLSALPGAVDVYAIANGFDLSRYPPADPRTTNRNNPRIVCVGELTRRKGQDLLVQAMPRIWQTIPGATLDLIGSGDMADVVRAQVRDVDPEGRRIRAPGHLSRPFERLTVADVFCLPSRSDNQPVAIIEAMCAGVPVVATDVGGIPELIAQADAGIVVPAESVDALADGLIRLLHRDDLQAMGARAATFARREYDVALMAERVEAVYRAAGAGNSERAHAGLAVVEPLRRT